MSNIWKMVMDWRYNPLSHTRHEHTVHGNAGAGVDVVHIFSMWVAVSPLASVPLPMPC